MVESAVSDRSRREKAWASMRWQPRLGPALRLGIEGPEGRAAVTRRVVRVRRSVGACMVDLRVARGLLEVLGNQLRTVGWPGGGYRVIEGKKWKG